MWGVEKGELHFFLALARKKNPQHMSPTFFNFVCKVCLHKKPLLKGACAPHVLLDPMIVWPALRHRTWWKFPPGFSLPKKAALGGLLPKPSDLLLWGTCSAFHAPGHRKSNIIFLTIFLGAYLVAEMGFCLEKVLIRVLSTKTLSVDFFLWILQITKFKRENICLPVPRCFFLGCIPDACRNILELFSIQESFWSKDFSYPCRWCFYLTPPPT